jgi:hypothetical protein
MYTFSPATDRISRTENNIAVSAMIKSGMSLYRQTESQLVIVM